MPVYVDVSRYIGCIVLRCSLQACPQRKELHGGQVHGWQGVKDSLRQRDYARLLLRSKALEVIW
jgi:hypothetical protein